MKKFINLFTAIFLLMFCQISTVFGNAGNPSTTFSSNEVTSTNNQTMQGQGFGYGQGGNATATGGNSESIAVSGDSGAIANISTNSTSNFETRTPPVSMFPPYLPTYNHGGWGTIQAYFPNGPTGNDRIYERAFYPGSKVDMKELKSSITAIPYEGPLSLVGGLLNGIGSIFGCPDNFHHGRGFDISSSLVRKRRPKDRPLYILIDSNINRDYLNTTGYVYVGKISLEGQLERNWDQVYKAAIAEALPWDVDLMLVSGGMKGVTVGTNTTFPAAGAAYAQTNYSVSLLGGRATGITEGKGMAMVSAECYRYYPAAAQSRTIPEAFYERIHAKNETLSKAAPSPKTEILPKAENLPGSETSKKIENPARVKTPTRIESSPRVDTSPNIQKGTIAKNTQLAPASTRKRTFTGVQVSQELYEMAGFDNQEQSDYMNIR